MFPLRQIVANARRVVPGFRNMASSGPLAGVEVDNEGVATITMQRPPVNSLNLELLQDLSKAFDEVSKNKCRAAILTSSSPTVFSAGLDIMEMYKPDMKRAEAFWSTLQEVWIKLFGSTFITAAAINGHAPAGGCMLSAACEYRVMVSGNFTIGLLESAIGIVTPYWLMHTVTNTISQRATELVFTTSKMYTVDEALEGHAPAGGCLLAMACEYRAMVNGKFTIGLNETALGIVAPQWFMGTMTNTISQRDAEYALTTARLFTVDEALKAGLIDETATDKDDSVAKCRKFIKKFDRIPPQARALTKLRVRATTLEWMEKNRTKDLQEFLGFVNLPIVQKSLDIYIQALKQKAAK